MRMTVYRERHRESIDWILEAARTDEWIDLERLTLDCLLHRRIVQQRNPRGGPQADERRFELQRLVHRFVDELLDDRFSPGAEGPRTETAAKALHAGNADAREFHSVAVERHDAGVGQDLPDLGLLAALDVVIPQHGGGRDSERCQLFREHPRL